jgi:hypothetical protein
VGCARPPRATSSGTEPVVRDSARAIGAGEVQGGYQTPRIDVQRTITADVFAEMRALTYVCVHWIARNERQEREDRARTTVLVDGGGPGESCQNAGPDAN